MAAVIYECRNCKNFWGDRELDRCEKCGSKNIHSDWQEERDFDSIDLDESYDLDEEFDEEI